MAREKRSSKSASGSSNGVVFADAFEEDAFEGDSFQMSGAIGGAPIGALPIGGGPPEAISAQESAHASRQILGSLTAFLTELDFNGGPVISADLLAKHGITVEGVTDPGLAIRQVSALVTALDEAAQFDPGRQHNQPPPALWVEGSAYANDVRALIVELRRLNGLLEESARGRKPADVAKAAGVFAIAGKKFVESYFDYMGKGAAALTISGIALLSVSLGVDKGTVEAIWNVLKPGK